ncbi:biosynthetic-type acetolactate synthase large subunit [Sporomusa termitida]|uniref:Acetolactate synthase n=1 Tax=Sporomusa termitida TaxID=2377 RepID=A0A517DRN9_9FIRM|nr:biosynthetic-type acetolactate synthase large subunit [Sporomusa termitida]QDR80019.1 Acetolactate synthase isozyme 2 large subunit [Sporomusa termitida]
MRTTGSKIIVDSLLSLGVDTVFGYPGGAIMPLYDALYDAPLRHILPVHEQGAAHAADGYARATGRVGVCIATSGPGATNLVTGLATAFMDSSPVVAITGQVATSLLGRDAFQEIDITGITMPVTKHNFLVRDINMLAETIQQAFAIAVSGRPGPVLVDVPRDILLGSTDYCPEIAAAPWPAPAPASPPAEQVQAAGRILAAARQPVLIIGGGVKAAQAEQQVLQLADCCGMPVVSTLMGLGVIPSGHPRLLGLTGMHGHKTANLAVTHADVIVAVGTRFSDRVTGDPKQYATGKTVIHFDIDMAEFDKNITADITIAGDLRQALTQLAACLTINKRQLVAWQQQIYTWQQQFPQLDDCQGLTPPWIMRHMSETTAKLAVAWVTDVGQNQMWAAQHLKIDGARNWVTSGGLGTMGFGLPAAMGAQAGCPDKKVVLIAGDGAFKMTGMELYTVVNQQLPLTCVLLNNRSLGMVRQWQQLFFDKRYSSTLLPEFDFAGFVRACGAVALAASTREQFRAAFKQALASAVPTVILVDIETDLIVKPMVYPGQPIDRFID